MDLCPCTRSLDASRQAEYKFEAILAHRWAGKNGMGALEYLICWRGYEASEDTCWPAGNLGNAGEILAEYKWKKKMGLKLPDRCLRFLPLRFTLNTAI